MPEMWTRISVARAIWTGIQKIRQDPCLARRILKAGTDYSVRLEGESLTINQAVPPKRRPRLVVFDVEGVLIPKRRYLLFEASRRLSILSFLRMLWAGFLYEAGLTSLEKALRRVFKQLQGLSAEDLFRLYKKIPLLQGVTEVFDRLKKAGCRTALISSGLPQAFVEDLASQFGCEYAFGLELEEIEGRLTGKIGGDVIKAKGKAPVLKRIQETEGVAPKDCALVADDRNNLPMFPLCTTRVGYNPDFVLAYKSDAVVKGSLTEVVPLLLGNPVGSHSVSMRDLFRETIHVAGFFVPVVTMYFGLIDLQVAFLISMVTLVYIASELARMLGVNVPILSKITWHAAIQPEIHEFVTAPIFFAVGIALTLIIFPPPSNYAAIAVFTLGDGFATIFGKKLGKHTFSYNKGKKVEGTIIGFVCAFLGALIFTSPIKAVVGAAVGMVVESLPTPLSDNITIPLAAGLAMILLP